MAEFEETDELEEELIDPDEFEINLASRTARLTAFLLDTALIATFVFMLLFTFIIPTYYGSAAQEFRSILDQVAANPELTRSEIAAQMTPQSIDMIRTCQAFTVFAFWIYFAFSEIITRGSSLGKKALSIRVVSIRDIRPPTYFDSFLRAGLKTLTLLAFFPFLMVSFLLIFISKFNQTGHDLLSRTLVITNSEEELDLDDEEDEEEYDDE